MILLFFLCYYVIGETFWLGDLMFAMTTVCWVVVFGCFDLRVALFVGFDCLLVCGIECMI